MCYRDALAHSERAHGILLFDFARISENINTRKMRYTSNSQNSDLILCHTFSVK